jgi:cytochrome c nitrite reductase small subunit
MPTSRPLYVLAVLLGIAGGVGAFTFRYAEGLSYMSSDPRACKNCHIMNEQFDAWRKSSHHAAATCNDCHLPLGFVAKYVAKASNGYHHSKGFTFQDFHEPILIKAKNSQILQDNCLRCHGELVHDVVRGSTYASGAIRCVHCHRSVGHGS